MKRSPIRRKPPRRHPMPDTVYWEVMDRDQGCTAHRHSFALDVDCSGRLHVHHIRLRSQGGEDDPDNLCVLCDLHHRWVHDIDRAGAEACGLIVRSTNAGSSYHRTATPEP